MTNASHGAFAIRRTAIATHRRIRICERLPQECIRAFTRAFQQISRSVGVSGTGHSSLTAEKLFMKDDLFRRYRAPVPLQRREGAPGEEALRLLLSRSSYLISLNG
jgi:hypothetical protein